MATSDHEELIARLHPDDPWLVTKRLARELYVPRYVRVSKNVTVPQATEYESMSAKQARGHGFEVDLSIPDEEEIEVEWIRNVNEEMVWYELRLKFIGRYSGKIDGELVRHKKPILPVKYHRNTTRAELSEAMENPLRFVRSEDLLKRIEAAIEFWMSHDMSNANIQPLVFILLGNSEGGAYPQKMFYIKEDNHFHLIVVDKDDKEIKISFKPGAREACVVRRFILFAPSNLSLDDPFDVRLEEINEKREAAREKLKKERAKREREKVEKKVMEKIMEREAMRGIE